MTLLAADSPLLLADAHPGVDSEAPFPETLNRLVADPQGRTADDAVDPIFIAAGPNVEETPDSPADEDDHVGFEHPADAGTWRCRPGTAWPTLVALGMSVVLHGSVIGGMILLVAIGVITPPKIPFAQGDGSATAGRVDLPGEANLAPGRPGDPLELPSLPADAPLEPIQPPPADAVALPPIDARPPAEPSWPIEVPSETEPADATDALPPADEMIARAPAMPKRQWNFPEPAPTTELPEQPVTRPAAGPTQPDSTDSAIADARTAAGRTGPNAQPGEARPASGTGHADGQGGAATGGGGTDITGRPGIPAGLPVGGLPQPIYPEISRRLGEEGRVLLAVEILPDGRVGGIVVESDGGHPRLASSAVDRLRGARVPFTPARDALGQPVRSVIKIPYDFVLGRR